MISKDQALTENMFHDAWCNRWRRNGQTKTWKAKANSHRFQVPVKWGLYRYGYVTDLNEAEFHVPGQKEGCKNDY